MLYTIGNDVLTITVENHGAQLLSVRRDDTEYIWQRDARFWEDCSPNLFPYIARLTDGTYSFRGQYYKMKIHGFVPYMDLELTEKTRECLTFTLTSSDLTESQYPWKFVYRITYRLEENCLHVVTEVENRDDKTMYFGVGGHPGFRIPLKDGLSYEDYYIELPEAERPVRIGFTPECYLSGEDEPFILPDRDRKRIPLEHSLFDQDAIVLKEAGHAAEVGSEKDGRRIRMNWEHEYLGIWSKPGEEAPYVCIEPWSSLPSRDGIVEDFEQQDNLIRLESGHSRKIEWTASFF